MESPLCPTGAALDRCIMQSLSKQQNTQASFWDAAKYTKAERVMFEMSVTD